MNEKIRSQIARLAMLLGLFTPASVMAVDFGVDVHAGTMGTGVGAAMQLLPTVNLRVGLNKYEYDIDIDDDEGLRYDGSLDFDNQYALVDWYPIRKGGFHLTAGLFFNDNEISGNATVVNYGDAQIGLDNAYAGTAVNSKLSFDGEAGYAGIGWGNTFASGKFNFGFDLGVVYQGEPKANINVTIPDGFTQVADCAAGDNSCIGQDDIAAEERDIEQELDDYDVHPLIQLTFGFKF